MAVERPAGKRQREAHEEVDEVGDDHEAEPQPERGADQLWDGGRDNPPEDQAGSDKAQVLRRVHPAGREGGIVGERQVPEHQHPIEQDERGERRPHGMEHPGGPGPPVEPAEERGRNREREQRRGHERQEHVLHHMDRKEVPGSRMDRRQQGSDQAEHARPEEERLPAPRAEAPRDPPPRQDRRPKSGEDHRIPVPIGPPKNGGPREVRRARVRRPE